MEAIWMSIDRWIDKEVAVKSESESCSVLSDSLQPYDSPWNSPGKDTRVDCHTVLQGSSQPRDQTQVPCIAGRFFTSWATRILLGYKKECIWVNSNEADKPTAYYTE